MPINPLTGMPEYSKKDIDNLIANATNHDKGYFATEAALTAAYPVGEAGWYAVVGETDTVWIWDVETAAWVDSKASLDNFYNKTEVDSLVNPTPVTLPTSGSVTIDASAGDKFIIPEPTGAITLSDSNFANMKEVIVDINNGFGNVSFPEAWRWTGDIPTLTDDGTDRIRLSHILYGATPKIIAEYLFSYLNMPVWNDITAASYDEKSFFMETQGTSVGGFWINKNHDKFWYISNNDKVITEYNFSTAKDISTAVIGDSISLNTEFGFSGTMAGLFVDKNEQYVWVCELSANKVLQFEMTTPGDITTLSLIGTFTIPSGSNASDVWVDDTGARMFVLTSDDVVRSYTMSTPNSILTASDDSKAISVGTQDSSPKGLVLDPVMERLLVVGYTNDRIYQYTLTDSGDLDTASYSELYKSIVSEIGTAYGLSIPRDGSKIYVLGSDRYIYQYSL